MFGRLLVGALIAVGIAGHALAACATYPNVLTNGTTADASQVMGNFNCAALTGAGSFTGSVGINITTPTDTLDDYGTAVIGANGERLSFNAGSVGFNRKVLTGQIYNPSYYAYQFQHNQGTSSSADFLAIQVYQPSGVSVSGYALSVNGAGDVGVNTTQATYQFYVNGSAAGTGNWINASDSRIKTDVTEIPNALDMVARLRGVRFQWRPVADRKVGKGLNLPVGQAELGFIAQEVEAVAPEAVVRPAKGSSEIYGLKEASIVPILVEAIKAQQAEIKQLQADLAAMKASR
jgi:hypothetical protein